MNCSFSCASFLPQSRRHSDELWCSTRLYCNWRSAGLPWQGLYFPTGIWVIVQQPVVGLTAVSHLPLQHLMPPIPLCLHRCASVCACLRFICSSRKHSEGPPSHHQEHHSPLLIRDQPQQHWKSIFINAQRNRGSTRIDCTLACSSARLA